MPHQAVGQMIDPLVSEPIANGASPAATITPEPLEEPHAQQSVIQGFRAAPAGEASPLVYPGPPANSIIAAFPIRMAPARSSFSTIVALWSKRRSANGGAPQVVGYPFTAIRSLAA